MGGPSVVFAGSQSERHQDRQGPYLGSPAPIRFVHGALVVGSSGIRDPP